MITERTVNKKKKYRAFSYFRPFKPSVTVDCLPTGNMQQCRWETGTMNVESVAAIAAAMEYIAGIGVRFGNAKNNTTKRGQLGEGYGVIQEHEENISRAFLKGNRTMQSGHEQDKYILRFAT